MNRQDMSEKIKILNKIIRDLIKTEPEEKLISLINLSASAEVSQRRNGNKINSELENEINTVIQKYKTNNSLIKTKVK